MCYFGPPPYKVVNVETGEATEYPDRGNWSLDKANAGELEPGFYYVVATGSYYMFYDGEKCWNDNNHYNGYTPPGYERYSFEYKKDWVDPLEKYRIDYDTLQNNKETVEKFLGQEKYEPLLANIYSGLGIPVELLKDKTCQN